MADEVDSKSIVGDHVWVQVPLPAGHNPGKLVFQGFFISQGGFPPIYLSKNMDRKMKKVFINRGFVVKIGVIIFSGILCLTFCGCSLPKGKTINMDKLLPAGDSAVNSAKDSLDIKISHPDMADPHLTDTSLVSGFDEEIIDDGMANGSRESGVSGLLIVTPTPVMVPEIDMEEKDMDIQG